MSVDRRRKLVEPDHKKLSIVTQCRLIGISRSGLYHKPAPETALNLELMAIIDKQFMQTPWYGSRQMAHHLCRLDYVVGRKRVRRLMAKMGLVPIYQQPRTTIPHPEHKKYRYLLKDLVINKPNQVWCSDITYIPMRKGFLYLVAVMDWAMRKVLSWKLSNSMEADFCIEALQEAIAKYGQPTIFNTDQGSQFTCPGFVDVLLEAGIKVSMDGKGRWMDNVFIERLWRSLKYECVYLHAFETGTELRQGLGKWIAYYNADRPHLKLGGATPNEEYSNSDTQPDPGLTPDQAEPELKLAA